MAACRFADTERLRVAVARDPLAGVVREIGADAGLAQRKGLHRCGLGNQRSEQERR